MPRRHTMTFTCDGRQLEDWISYDLKTSITEPADSFAIELAFERTVWELVRCDRAVRCQIDGVTVIDGFIDERIKNSKEGRIRISGRDKVGRLVQESAPQVNYAGLQVKALFEKLAAPWFTSIEFSNTRNRRVVRGKGHKVRDSGVVFVDGGRKGLGTRIEPGQARFQAMAELAEQMGALIWSAGDGRTLIVGEPNYDQEIQYRFFQAGPGSARARETNVEDMRIRESVADYYSRIIALGSGAGSDANYGIGPSQRAGDARDSKTTPEGVGGMFRYPKRLIIADRRAFQSAADARKRAELELAKRAARAHVVEIDAPTHGQVVLGTEPTLFANDCMAWVEDEETGLRAPYLTVSCNYHGDRGSESTGIELLRKGSKLTP